jgi:hypothetical protein
MCFLHHEGAMVSSAHALKRLTNGFLRAFMVLFTAAADELHGPDSDS